jgi:hypothetical protein
MIHHKKKPQKGSHYTQKGDLNDKREIEFDRAKKKTLEYKKA